MPRTSKDRQQIAKTYNIGHSHLVTDRNTDPLLYCLYIAKQTGFSFYPIARPWKLSDPESNGVLQRTAQAIEAKRQGATGDGLVINVLEAYNFVVNNYSPGEKIYCFGFSRGAFTARAIAGMITNLGVMKPENMKTFASLFAAYQKNTSKYNFRKTKEYFEWKMGKAPFVPERQKETCDVKIPWYDMGTWGDMEYENSRSIELVGVFDTVGSLGLADTYVRSHASSRRVFEWLNVKLNPCKSRVSKVCVLIV